MEDSFDLTSSYPRLSHYKCFRQSCAFFNDWGSWTDCSVTCGGGSRARSRYCVNGVRGDPGCIGQVSEREECQSLV